MSLTFQMSYFTKMLVIWKVSRINRSLYCFLIGGDIGVNMFNFLIEAKNYEPRVFNVFSYLEGFTIEGPQIHFTVLEHALFGTSYCHFGLVSS